MIRVHELVKDFGPRRAVDGVSFDVAEGAVLGFLGPNGAGKTTTMRMITGFLRPTAGYVLVRGQVLVEKDPVAARAHMGYMPENAPLYDDMTVEEFLRFVAELRGFSGAERNRRAGAAIEKCLLQPVQKQTIETLSKGYKQRVSLAQAILHDPPILILDEPTEGLDPNQKHVVRTMIREMGREKVIVLSTHVLEEVEAICSRVIIISEGRLVVDKPPEQLKRSSTSYNAVTIRVVAPADEAVKDFEALPDVQRVEVLERSEERQSLKLFPRNGQPIAVPVLDLARRKKWLVMDMQTDGGRLDEVFRSLTTTEDVGKEE